MPADVAFARVIETYGPALARLVAAYEAEPADREDLMQEVMLALWNALPGFRGECSERTFVYRVAHNRALTYRHRTHRARTVPLDDAMDVVDPRADPEGDATSAQRRDALLAAVATLPPAYRQVVLLRLEGLGNGEIAEVLGATENTVAIRLTRARKALATALGTLEERPA
jgi:RNA polymerase sigma-70 factor (ECF subfamily)